MYSYRRARIVSVPSSLCVALMISACSPRVEVAVPDKPITINLNIKIDHEVRVKVEKDLENEVFSEDSNLF